MRAQQAGAQDDTRDRLTHAERHLATRTGQAGAKPGNFVSWREGGDDGAGAASVIMLGHAYWLAHFSADSSIVGRTMRIGNRQVEVIGVLQPKKAVSSLLGSKQ